ncbi:MAG: hypothetical protein HY287_17535 [Planctomycetes bacterium]|nr:hypothetical protein [Planctomycetota bacterium]
MRILTWSAALFCSGLCLGVTPVQELPDNRIQIFKIHEDPSNPLSQVTTIVTAHLSAMDRIDDKVAWRIDSLEFYRPATAQTWTKTLPTVSTSDGLWWIKHADADAPQASEFLVPPSVTGEAIANSSAYANLAYDLVGHSYTGTGPYAITSSLSYYLHPIAGLDPDDEGDHEPVESSGGPETG